jgi:hypothetical protein
VDNLPVSSAREVEVPHEHVPRIQAVVSIPRVAVALEPSRVIIATPRIVFGVFTSRAG